MAKLLPPKLKLDVFCNSV